MWLEDIERDALAQAEHLANLPFIFKHVALMPDAHVGFGMPIGGVLATDGVVIPNAVGVDIGCGMCAVRASLPSIDAASLRSIAEEIRKVVPVGFSHHPGKQDRELMPQREFGAIVAQEYENALTQIGTLGGGNHFIEVQKGSDERTWVMLHSGSRNLGLQVATHYNRLAKSLNTRWYSAVPHEWDLAFLPLDTREGQDYLLEMSYCVDFALANRRLMMERICGIINDATGAACEPMINIAHNYAAMENHFGRNVIVHRKGATRAIEGLTGIIPGSMGTKSYIVEGLGNRESFMSCSHGAGRKMGRKQAQQNLDLQEQIDLLDQRGIIHGLRAKSGLDEAPGAYKDIDQVMENQKDLVKIAVELQPLAVVKG
jgi:tRNA-splicing ligase RtcB